MMLVFSEFCCSVQYLYLKKYQYQYQKKRFYLILSEVTQALIDLCNFLSCVKLCDIPLPGSSAEAKMQIKADPEMFSTAGRLIILSVLR